MRWLHAQGRALEVPDAALRRGDLVDALHAPWSPPQKPPVQPTGADEVAALRAAHCR